jgi:hypothetical protein
MRYEDLREHLRTGDLVLFSGRSPVSRLIQWATRGPWSHVGMVVRLRELGDAVLLWESTTLSDLPGTADDGTVCPPRRGVQLVSLSQRLAGYDGDAAVRQLDRPITFAQRDALSALRHRLARRPYERHRLELLRSSLDAFDACGRQNREDLSSLFCSELVAEAYQAMGLLPEPPRGLPSNEYTPMDFAEARDARLPLRRGFRLGAEVSLPAGSTNRIERAADRLTMPP